jgi:hypothetical protein
MIDVAGQSVLPEYIGRPVTAEPMVWPALLALRERIPHPLLIDEPERTDFIAAVEQWDRRIDERMFLIERASLAWVERYGEPPRSFARLRSGRPWRPLHYPDTFDPADGVLPQLLRAAVALVKGWGDQTPTLFSSAKVLEIWESSRAALGPLVESAYARMIARVLDIEWALRPSRTSQSVSDDLVWRLVLLEAILRESAGAVRALAHGATRVARGIPGRDAAVRSSGPRNPSGSACRVVEPSFVGAGQEASGSKAWRSERTFQIAQRVHRAFVESTMADARRDRLIGEYARAARAWQARGQSLGLEVAMQRSGLDARIRELMAGRGRIRLLPNHGD